MFTHPVGDPSRVQVGGSMSNAGALSGVTWEQVSVITPSTGDVLSWDGSKFLPAAPAAGLSDVVADTTPQLGGNLDVNGNSIVSVSNGNITLAPNGTGKVVLSGIQYPTVNGTNGQVLTTNGSGVASWATPSGGGNGIIIFGSRDIEESGSVGFSFSETTGTAQINNYMILSTGGVSGVSRVTTYENRAMTLPAGTYLFEWNGGYAPNTSITNFTIVLRNITNSTNLLTLFFRAKPYAGSTYRYSEPQQRVFTISETSNIRLQTGTPWTGATSISVVSDIDMGNGTTINLKFIKLA
jgi:hypothetical protein